IFCGTDDFSRLLTRSRPVEAAPCIVNPRSDWK
ncbi:rCG37813, partial [Rattus norvegicus]